MATNTSVQGSVTLRKLRSGSTVGVSIWTSQQLFQTYEAGNKDTIAPDWSKEPYLTCKVIVNGEPYTGTVDWQINGTSVTSMKDINVAVDSGTLTIKSNLARVLNYQNGTLKAAFTLDQTPMVKTTDITIMQVTGSQYNVLLSANNNGVVDDTNGCTITAKVLLGTKEPTDASKLYYKWWSADGRLNVASKQGNKTCTVTAADVDGMELFFCSVSQSEGGEALDTSAIAIVDNSDPFRLTATITEGAATTGQDNQTLYDVPEATTSVKVKFSVVKSDGSPAPTSATNGATWLIKKYHSDTMNLITGSSDKATSTGGSKAGDDTSKSTSDTITVYDCDYLSSEKLQGMTAATHNTNVIVQADCTLNA